MASLPIWRVNFSSVFRHQLICWIVLIKQGHLMFLPNPYDLLVEFFKNEQSRIDLASMKIFRHRQLSKCFHLLGYTYCQTSDDYRSSIDDGFGEQWNCWKDGAKSWDERGQLTASCLKVGRASRHTTDQRTTILFSSNLSQASEE